MSQTFLGINKAPDVTPDRQQYGGEHSKTKGNGDVSEETKKVPHKDTATSDTDVVNQSETVTDGLIPGIPVATCDVTASLENKEGISQESLEAFEIVVQQSTERLDTDRKVCYKMGSRPKGYALVISNETLDSDKYPTREGADKDCENVKKLLTDLGYEVKVYKDLTKTEFQNKVIALNSLKHDNVDSTVLFILTRAKPGSSGSIDFITSDSQSVNSEWVVEQFHGKYCAGLMGKPKLFFFLCCSDSERQKNVKTPRKTSVQIDGGICEFVPNTSDILIVDPCAPGNVALRCEEHRSWLVYFLCKVFMENAHKKDIVTMLNLVSRKMRQKFYEDQGTDGLSPTFMGFDKKLFFNPGLYD